MNKINIAYLNTSDLSLFMKPSLGRHYKIINSNQLNNYILSSSDVQAGPVFTVWCVGLYLAGPVAKSEIYEIITIITSLQLCGLTT